ncbi:uncharacterized protein N0V89_002458 [Didymosphaeria variabile]|uniref:Uncharacterized protein n=1 Tax=Didymosphaeria variabile TaxID=1932322 RepID=A0A9W8XSK1_9PLEO|nr:uncharacterized protein N0V89_002458 [Didymosphaeria variabile]KAJ4357881.1 hypothetical protein N0V89_002458 [Didymosphaeria variabile]
MDTKVTTDAAAFDRAKCTSAWEKADYQTIKEGGYREVFIKGHCLSIYEPGDFNKAKNLLDGYQRIDAETAGECMPVSDYGFYRVNGCSRRRQKSIRSYHNDGDNNDFVSDHEDDRRVLGGRASNSASRASGQRYVAYEESFVSGNGDERDSFEVSDDGSHSPDCGSTDAIDHYSESGADDNNDEIGGDDLVDNETIDDYDDDDYD